MAKQIENFIKELKDWLKDYEKQTGECYGDDETFEGTAYNLITRAIGYFKDKI